MWRESRPEPPWRRDWPTERSTGGAVLTGSPHSRLLLLAALLAGPLGADEAPPGPSVREKLRTRIKETLPPAPPKPEGPTKAGEEEVLVLEPVVVTVSRGVRELEKLLGSEQARQEAEAFAPLKGGTIYRGDRLELGGWWDRSSGWRFLKIKW